jgi:hypothetical protein
MLSGCFYKLQGTLLGRIRTRSAGTGPEIILNPWLFYQKYGPAGLPDKNFFI